jgi:hypothetical protein
MDSFFYGSNKETYYGSGGVGINLSGSDWLGLGEWMGGVSEGTELCGARPMFAGKDRDKYNECVANSLAFLQGQSATQAQIAQQKLLLDAQAKKDKIKIAIIGAVALVVIVLGVAIIKRRRNE